MSSKSNVNCCVYGCKSVRKRNPSLTYHSFPQPGKEMVPLDDGLGGSEQCDRRKVWESKLRMGKKATNAMKVCSLHFKQEDYHYAYATFFQEKRQPRLLSTAIPSQNLPSKTLKLTKDEFAALRLKRLEKRNKNHNKNSTNILEPAETITPNTRSDIRQTSDATENSVHLGQVNELTPTGFKYTRVPGFKYSRAQGFKYPRLQVNMDNAKRNRSNTKNKNLRAQEYSAANTTSSIEHIQLQPCMKLEDDNFQGNSIQHINLIPDATFSTTLPLIVKLEEDNFEGQANDINSSNFSIAPQLNMKVEDSDCEETAVNLDTNGTTYNSHDLSNFPISTALDPSVPDPLSLEHQPVTLSMSVCRVCMKNQKHMIGLDCMVSDNELRMTTIEEMLNGVSRVSAKINDGLPPRVCQECLQRIFDAYQLIKQYELSNATMLDMLKKVRSENEPDVSKEITKKNTTGICSTNSERIFCPECNITVLKPDLYIHMLKCKMITSAIDTSSKKRILICRGCNYLINPEEMNEHRKTCSKEVHNDHTTDKDTKVDQVDGQHTNIDQNVSNISQEQLVPEVVRNTTLSKIKKQFVPEVVRNSTLSKIKKQFVPEVVRNSTLSKIKKQFVPEVVRNSTLSKIKEQFNNDFKKHKDKTKSNESSCELVKQGETMIDIGNSQEKKLQIPESLITLKRNIDVKFMNNRKLVAEGVTLVKCTVCNVQMLSREIEFHKIICKPPRPTFWKINEGEGGMYSCNLCDKTCDTLCNASVRGHINQHNALRTKILCSTCGKSVRKSMWKSHQNKHLGIKPYTCDICSQKFTLANELTNHMRRHTQEKPYQCKLCSKQFSQLKYLAVHTRVHTGEKPYSCVICGKGFIVSGNLHVHMKTHDVTEMHVPAVKSDTEGI